MGCGARRRWFWWMKWTVFPAALKEDVMYKTP